MRTPTALLRIGALFGNHNAREKLSIRQQLKPITLKQIRNHLPTGWLQAPRIDTRVKVCIPRAKLATLPPHLGMPAASRLQPCIPTSVSNRLPCIVASKDTSWLHHGPGGRIPVPQNGRQLHPLGLERPSAARESPGSMDTLDQQAMSLIQGEKDLVGFFGAMDKDPADAIPVASVVPAASQTDVLIPDADYDSDTESMAVASDSDSEDDCELPTPEEVEAANRRFVEETREIEAFDAMLGDYSVPPPPPTPPLETTATSVSPSTLPSPVRIAETRFTGPAKEDLMAEILQAFAQRQMRQASIESSSTGTTFLSSPARSPAASAPASPLAAGLAKGFVVLSERHKESLSGSNSDSGRASNLPDSGEESDHGWSDSEA